MASRPRKRPRRRSRLQKQRPPGRPARRRSRPNSVDWFAPIDLYCERTAPGLFNEPLNAASNLAFFVAAMFAARVALRDGRARTDAFLWLLIGLVFVIGAGSTAFHMFANRWSLIADVAPITAFIYGFFLLALRRLAALPRRGV